jgi:peroxiredoxin
MKQLHIFTGFLFLLLFTDIAAQAQKFRSAEEAKGLEVGARAPDFSAIDAKENTFQLAKALQKQPVVIIFYRGYWCPVCNRHLSQLQDSLKQIEKAGARVIAISPEKPEYLEKMAGKTGAGYTLLYDEGYKIADAYDVTFKPDEATLDTYNKALGANLKETHSDTSQRLPIPATYVVDQQGKIIWRQLDPNYKNRSTVKGIVEAINTLR